jgi:amino acid adenylation domain-containing protein
MVEDSGAALLLTQSHLAGQIAVPIPVLLLDGAPDPAAGRSEENPPADTGTGPDQAAYVIYTSGSTGRPKGVVAINSGLAAFARSMADVLHATPADRYLQFPSFSFDASLVSIAATLATGATLVLHPRVTELSLAELQAFCAAQGVTLVDQPAAFLREIVGHLAASDRPQRLLGNAPLRALNTGGESLSREILHQWARGERSDTLFLDSYGPTEATVATTIYTTTAQEAIRMERATIPLGRPLPGVEVYLLDEALHPVPLGVPGDLYVGGVGLTRGYLHRPDLTAEAFLPHPLSPHPGARLYRTGDRARWLPDGTLEFLGRRDAQVKIRGFRVELEEIESALLRHPAVAQAAVLLLEGDRLAAYVVPVSDTAGDLTSTLRDHLRATLPDPMVPAAFVVLDRLPRTPGGKLDRRNLPRPEIARPAARDLVPPRDGVEQTIAALWQRLLSLETVGIHDNFFELGGHSLLGTRVIAALREEFGVDVPLRALFEKPTIADLALAVAQARVEQSTSSEVDALLDSLEDLTDEEVEALLAAQAGGGDPPA